MALVSLTITSDLCGIIALASVISRELCASGLESGREERRIEGNELLIFCELSLCTCVNHTQSKQ